ncbi:MAG: trimeric intracellular cation channel family protein [Phormidesmis sp.]
MDDFYILHSFDFFGTFVFAISGALIAYEQRRGGFRAAFYAALTALGGGTMRDLLLAHKPVFWVRSPAYLWIAIAGGLLTFVLAQFARLQREKLWFAEILSLGIFSIVGTQIAISIMPSTSWLDWLIPPLMGLLTAVGGGMVRDVIDGEIPFVMQHPDYAFASFTSGSLYRLLMTAHIPAIYAISGAIAIAFLFISSPLRNLVLIRKPVRQMRGRTMSYKSTGYKTKYRSF